jgi:hypothetical protein
MERLEVDAGDPDLCASLIIYALHGKTYDNQGDRGNEKRPGAFHHNPPKLNRWLWVPNLPSRPSFQVIRRVPGKFE